MSGGGRHKTPARVQVFYFQKKTRAATATVLADDLPTNPGPEQRALASASGAKQRVSEQETPASAAPTPPATPVTVSPAQLLRQSAARDPQPRIRAPIAAGAAESAQQNLQTPPRNSSAPVREMSAVERRLAVGAIASGTAHVARAESGPGPAPSKRTPDAPPLTVPDVSPSSGEETLEYHRLKLQELAQRQGTESLAGSALFGHALFARGRTREAQVVFESIVAREPEEAFAYTMLGAIFLAQGDESRALALFDAALSLDRGDLAALVSRGEIRLHRAQAKLALQDLEKAISADPGGKDPFSDRARALMILARTQARAER